MKGCGMRGPRSCARRMTVTSRRHLLRDVAVLQVGTFFHATVETDIFVACRCFSRGW